MASTLRLNASILGHCDIFRAGRSFFWRWYRPAQDIPSGISGRYCERLRKVDYSSYEFTVDIGKSNDKYGITDRQLSVYHYERIRFLMYKKITSAVREDVLSRFRPGTEAGPYNAHRSICDSLFSNASCNISSSSMHSFSA